MARDIGDRFASGELTPRISRRQQVWLAIAIASLGIIFVPFVWQKSDLEGRTVKGSNIPVIPDTLSTLVFRLESEGVFKEEDLALPLSSEQIRQRGSAGTTGQTSVTAPSQDEVNATTGREEVATIEGATSVWMVKLGVYESEKKALKLRDRLRTRGFPTYVEPFKTEEGKDAWLIKLGPEMSVKRAETLRVRVQEATGLEGVLIRHR